MLMKQDSGMVQGRQLQLFGMLMDGFGMVEIYFTNHKYIEQDYIQKLFF